jgi:hypothetical protein
MFHITLLWKNELKMFRNSSLGSKKQIIITISVALFTILITALLTSTFFLMFKTIKATLGPILNDSLFSLVCLLIYAWVGLLVFFSIFSMTREKYLHTPDLEFLISTPIHPIKIFLFRFFMVSFFSPSTIFQVAIFGLAPLIAAGIAFGAAPAYYPLLLPLLYIYSIVPAALAVAVMMLLVRHVPTKVLFGLATAMNLLMTIGWMAFMMRDQAAVMEVLLQLIDQYSGIITQLLITVNAAVAISEALFGTPTPVIPPLATLMCVSAAVLAVSAIIVSRVYYRGYERISYLESSQLVKHRKLKGKTPVAAMVACTWKRISRNKEMAQAAIFTLSLLIAYGFIMHRLNFDASVTIVLINSAVVSFFANLTVQVLVMPSDYLADRTVYHQQFWMLKASPLQAKTVVAGMLAATLPAEILLALVVATTINLAAGMGLPLTLVGMVVIIIMHSGSALLGLYTVLLELMPDASNQGAVIKILRNILQILYYLIAMVLAGFIVYYRKVPFMATLSETTAGMIGAVSFVALSSACIIFAHKASVAIWNKLEL